MTFATKCRHGISLADAEPCRQCAIATQNVDSYFKEKQVNDPSSPPAQCCDHGVPLIYECAKCYRETELKGTKMTKENSDDYLPTGEVLDSNGKQFTPHEFSCKILEYINEGVKLNNLEIRTLCLMIQRQASQLRQIKQIVENLENNPFKKFLVAL